MDDRIARRSSARDRLLVCVSEQPGGEGLVRSAQALAERLGIGWTALYIETHRNAVLTDAERERLDGTLRLAVRLGGEAVTLPGDGIAAEILAFARETNVGVIVVAKSTRSRWFELRHGSVVGDLVRGAGDIDVHVVGGAGAAPAATGDGRSARRRSRRRFRPVPYMASTLFIAFGTLFGTSLLPTVGEPGIALMLLTQVLITAVCFGLGPSLLASVLSVLAYDYFFTAPLYSLAIDDSRDIAALILFAFVAVITSNLTARTRAQVLIARNHAKTTAELYAFSRRLAGIVDIEELLSAMTSLLVAMLHSPIAIFLVVDGVLQLRAATRDAPPSGAADRAEVERVAAGRPTSAAALPADDGWAYVPLRTARGTMGVLSFGPPADDARRTANERRFVAALADQAAIAIERILFAAEIDETRMLRESERLRAALLTSLSHDLRTPLASVLGALTSLRSFDDQYDAETRRELLDTAQEEAERLNRFVGNLLDMTKLESGAIEVRRDPVDLADVVGSAVRRAGRILGGRRVRIDCPADLPMAPLDFVLLEQALFNILDNAAKYAAPESTITVSARQRAGAVVIEIADEGPGIPAADLERIFDKFYRVRSDDRQRAGTGLGLVVSRGFVEAQGGHIVASNRTDRSGAVFTIAFPLQAPDPAGASIPSVVS
jgi:two-component system sensor histidine kinase KdpD